MVSAAVEAIVTVVAEIISLSAGAEIRVPDRSNNKGAVEAFPIDAG